MKLKNNIYFYISIAALIFIYVLVYYFYEKEFELQDFIDAKTFVLVLGTIIGAYFGASKAGEYSVNVMLEQQRLLKEEKVEEERINNSKYKTYLLTRIKNDLVTINTILEISKKDKVNGSHLKSMQEFTEEIQKTEKLFDNIDFLKFEEDLIPKYLDLQVYLRAIVSISHTLRGVHELFESDYKSEENQNLKDTDLYITLQEVTKQLIKMINGLANTINQIENR